jgi:hypothetical protein
MKMNRSQKKAIREVKEEDEDLEKYPLDALKEIYENDYGETPKVSVDLLDELIPETAKESHLPVSIGKRAY